MSAIDLFAAFATNEVAEVEGIETQIPGCGDTLFLVARDGNKPFNKLLQKLVKQSRAVLDSKGPAADKRNDEIYAEVLGKTILLGWQGSVNIQGVMTPYSYAAALKMLGLKEFRAAVLQVSEDVEVFRMAKEEEDAKNS